MGREMTRITLVGSRKNPAPTTKSTEDTYSLPHKINPPSWGHHHPHTHTLLSPSVHGIIRAQKRKQMSSGGGGEMEGVEEEEVVVVGSKEDGRLRVLVVDDSPVDRRIVELLLKRNDGMLEVIVVDSGKKAMELLGLNAEKVESPMVNDQKIDIILTDYCMPQMTGYDLLIAVKEQSFPKSIPVVIMSSENDPQRISRCRAVGAEDFILKPLQPKDVQRLRSFSRPKMVAPPLAPKIGSKRKMPLDLIVESNGAERRQCLAEVAVA